MAKKKVTTSGAGQSATDATDSGEPDLEALHLRATDSDGAAQPYSLDEQWDLVSAWYEAMQADSQEIDPRFDTLKTAWEAQGWPFPNERGSELKRAAESPLALCFYYLEFRLYPPPELLYAMHDVWKLYLFNRGSTSLEEAFFGCTARGIGNYAARANSRLRTPLLWMEMDVLTKKEGMSRQEAAESLSNQRGGRPDADSILRMLRGTQLTTAKPKPEK